MARKSVNFNVSQETYDEIRSIFPDVVGAEDNLKQLLQGYKFYLAHKDDNPSVSTAEITALRNQIEQQSLQLSKKDDEINALSENMRDLSTNHEQQLNDLKEQIQTLEEQNVQLAGVISERDTTITDLEAREVTWAQIRTTLQPFTVALLEATAKKLSQKYNKNIHPMAILTDMFLRYTVERWNEWFYKFCLSDSEIVAIAKSVNPDISSISQVKKLVCK